MNMKYTLLALFAIILIATQYVNALSCYQSGIASGKSIVYMSNNDGWTLCVKYTITCQSGYDSTCTASEMTAKTSKTLYAGGTATTGCDYYKSQGATSTSCCSTANCNNPTTSDANLNAKSAFVFIGLVLVAVIGFIF